MTLHDKGFVFVLEGEVIGSRPEEIKTCSGVDMMSVNADGGVYTPMAALLGRAQRPNSGSFSVITIAGR